LVKVYGSQFWAEFTCPFYVFSSTIYWSNEVVEFTGLDHRSIFSTEFTFHVYRSGLQVSLRLVFYRSNFLLEFMDRVYR